MTLVVTIIPAQGKTQPETLFINFSTRSYDDIQDCSISYEEHCKYMGINLDGEFTTRVFFREYKDAVRWCKNYIRESENIVKVDDNTGLTNNQENWYNTVIKTHSQVLMDNDPDNYAVCHYCGFAFHVNPSYPKKKFCCNQHRNNFNKNKLKNHKQPIDKVK